MPRYDEYDDREERGRRPSWDEDDRQEFRDRPSRERWREDDYDPYRPRRPERPQGSSTLGTVSFAIGIIAGLGVLLAIGAATVMTIQSPNGQLDENSPEAMIAGLGIIGCLGLALVGVVLGVVALLGSNPSKVFAWLGTVINALILLGTVGLICIGIAIG